MSRSFHQTSVFAAAIALFAGLAATLSAADPTTWPSQYNIRPAETARLTAADVVGPDGIVYPDFTGVGVTGGVPDVNNSGIRATYTVYNVLNYGANGSDTGNDSAAVASAATAARNFLDANAANKAILYFPSGTYYLTDPIVFTQSNIVIDGNGPASTFIKLKTATSKTGGLFAVQRAPAFAAYLTATTLVPRGGNTLTLNADPVAAGYSIGSWVRLAPTVSGTGTPVSDRYSLPAKGVTFTDAFWHTGRILFAKVTALNAGARTVTLDRTFTHDYFVNESPQLRRVSMAENTGVQDLSIETLTATATVDPIRFEYTANSWIKNVTTVKAKSWPINIDSSARFEVSDCQFQGTWINIQQGGGVAYLGWTGFVTDVLMENCQASALRHMAIFQAANRSVIRGCTFSGKSVQSPQLHGRFPHENLVEDNTFNTTTGDGSGGTRGITAYGADNSNSLVHGPNGPRNVFYNNRVLSGMGTSVFGGTSEGFIFAYNRILKSNDIEAKPAIMAMDRTFDFIVRGNIFQAIETLPAITLADPTCTGWAITDNKFYGTNGSLYEGDSAPALSHNNRFSPIATPPAAVTTPEVASIYSWQKANAATARLVLTADRRSVTDTGGTTPFTVVRVKSSTAAALTVNLSATPIGLSVPATVTILAGETSATFTVTGTDVTNEQLVTLTATASGLLADSEKVAVLDQAVAQPNSGILKWPVAPLGLPASWKAGDYGQITAVGTQTYTPGTDTWVINGGGIRTETFHGSLARSGRRFVYQTMNGDGEIRARITAASGEQQVGLMIADDEAALTDFIWVEPNGRVFSSSNDSNNGLGNGVPIQLVAAGSRIVPSWLRLKRVGSVFTAYRSIAANPASEGDWSVLATVDLYLNPVGSYKSPAVIDGRMHYGFFINSGSASTTASATFTGTTFSGTIVPLPPVGLDQTLTFPALLGKSFGDAAFALTATASSGLTVSYNSSNPNVATISGNTVTLTGPGSSTITATQAGNATYNPAPPVLRTLTVSKAAQTISFAALAGKTLGNSPFALAASASSGLTVSYDSSNPSVATISGNTVTITGPGSTTITAAQAGDDNYDPATAVAQSLTVTSATPLITAGQSANGTHGTPFNYQILVTSGSPTSYALASGSLPPGIALNTTTGLLSGTPSAAGTYTPAFTATSNSGTSPAVVITLNIATGSGSSIVYEPFAYTVGSNNPDPDGGLNSTNGLPATNVGGNPTGTSTGLRGAWGTTLVVSSGLNYSQGANTFQVTGGAAAPNNATWGTDVFFYRDMATDPHLAQRIGASSSANFGADGTTLFLSLLARTTSAMAAAFRLKLGGSSRNVFVENTATGWSLNENAAGAVATTATLSLNTTTLLVVRINFITGIGDTISLWVNPTLGAPLGTANATLNTTVDFGGLASIITRPSTVNAMTLDEFRMGISYAAVTPFSAVVPAPAAPSGLIATANSASQITLNWTDNANDETGYKLERSPDGTSAWTQIATPTTNATSEVNSALTHATPYFYRIRATNSGGDSGWSATASATTLKLDQEITFSALAGSNFGDPTFALTATASSDLPVSYSSSNSDVATISGNIVTVVSPGTTTITATQVGNASYNPATASAQNLTVSKAAQTLSFPALAAKTFGDAAFPLTATASSGLIVSYISSDPAVATISGSTVTIIGAGSTTITATQEGDANYLTAADESQLLTISPAPTVLAVFRTTHGLAADGSQDLLIPAEDGISNILKYAFNMLGSGAGQAVDLTTPNVATLTSAGSAGLPMVGMDATGKLQITYIRRKASSNPGITYAVKLSSDLGVADPWNENAAATESATSLDDFFERVTLTDSVAANNRFAKVHISIQ